MIADTVGPDGAHRHRRVARSAPTSSSVALSGHRHHRRAAERRVVAGAAEAADLLAAQFAGGEVGPVLRTEERDRARARRRARKPRGSIAGAAAALFVVAAVVRAVGRASPARSRSRRARAAPAADLSSTLVGRTTVDAAYRHLATLSALERAAPHWSSVIATLDAAVPDDAHLTAIRARSDSVIVDGVAEHAARVFDALERADGLVDVRAASPVRRELQEGGANARPFHDRGARRRGRRRPSASTAPASNVGVGAEARPMKWSTMNVARSSRRDRSARWCCCRRCSSSGAFGRIRPRCPTRASNWLTERATLARERAAIATARKNPQLQHIADSAMRAMRPRLFEGKDDVMASAELASYLGDVAQGARVWLQDAGTRPAVPAGEGVRTLRVEIRAESDLLGDADVPAGAGARRQARAHRPVRHLAIVPRRREGRRDAVDRGDDCPGSR